MKKYLLYALFLTSFMFVSCSKNNSDEPAEDKRIEISLRVDDFTKSGEAFRTIERNQGSDAERIIKNLYLFLFDNNGTNPVRYYIDGSTFAGGTWNPVEMKVKLDMTQNQAGLRRVYVVANVDNTIKTALDVITTENGLQNVKKTISQPWSLNMASPFLMSGNKTHDFTTDYLLDNVQLVRAVAKIELNITLSEKFQTLPAANGGNLADYRYRYVNFDKDTYVVKPLPTKPDNPVSSNDGAWPQIAGWMPWGTSLNVSPAPDAGSGYTMDSGGKIKSLRIITYLNERDKKGAAVEVALPRVDDGELPPPEFGPELYRLPLPEKVLRNHWYKYEVEI